MALSMPFPVMMKIMVFVFLFKRNFLAKLFYDLIQFQNIL